MCSQWYRNWRHLQKWLFPKTENEFYYDQTFYTNLVNHYPARCWFITTTEISWKGTFDLGFEFTGRGWRHWSLFALLCHQCFVACGWGTCLWEKTYHRTWRKEKNQQCLCSLDPVRVIVWAEYASSSVFVWDLNEKVDSLQRNGPCLDHRRPVFLVSLSDRYSNVEQAQSEGLLITMLQREHRVFTAPRCQMSRSPVFTQTIMAISITHYLSQKMSRSFYILKKQEMQNVTCRWAACDGV